MPESYHKKMYVRSHEDCALTEYIQIINSRAIYEFLMSEGQDLYDNGIHAKRFRDAILTNLLHTSIVSGFADGSGQLAIAHATYDFMRNYHTAAAAEFLHGELVAVGLMIQMAFNGYPDEEIERVRSLMRYMHMPLTLRDFHYDVSEEGIEFFLKKIAEATGLKEDEDLALLKKSVAAVL
jgi:glycerol dehydrogenase